MKWKIALLILCSILLAMAGCQTQPQTSETPPAAVTTPSPAPTPESTPTVETISPEKLEFSIMIGDKPLTLGKQSGTFPWGVDLESDSEEYWSSDGFHCFTLTCGSKLRIQGSCQEKNTETTENGWLDRIENQNSNYKTYRGAYIGMLVEDFLVLYPEAYRMESVPEVIYSYTDEPHCGFYALRFTFENDLLVNFWLVDGMDGWAY